MSCARRFTFKPPGSVPESVSPRLMQEFIAAQIRSLVEAWEWNEDDRILLTLPLHHIHGIINVIGCALCMHPHERFSLNAASTQNLELRESWA